MPTNRHPIRHPQRGRLNHDREMVLRYGPDPRWPAFRSENEYRDAWLRNREKMLAGARHGRRPMAWWRFEAGDLRYPGDETERSMLYQAGLLGEEELRELVAWWRQAFEKAQAPDFWLCLGPGRALKGVPARRAHYRWADIPRELLLQWTREHRRRGRTIRGLAETAAGYPAPTA
jgi:hypothetical protein